MSMFGSRSTRLPAVLAAIGAGLVACSDSTPPDDFAAIAHFATADSSISIPRGGAIHIAFTVERSRTFMGEVTLSASSPPGVSAVFNPPVLPSTRYVGQLTISSLPSVVPGDYVVVVQASGVGVETRTVPINVIVTQPGIALAQLSPISMEEASSIATPVVVTRTGGYTGPVNLSVTGLPVGVTGTVDPAVLPAGESTSTLKLTAVLGAQLGTLNLQMRATAPGISDQLGTVQLSVLPTTVPAVQLQGVPEALKAFPGDTVQSEVQVTRYGGYTGPVSLDVDGLPPGASAIADPVADGETTGTLRIALAPDAPPVLTQFQVRGTGTQIEPSSATMALEVRPLPDITIQFREIVNTVPIPVSYGTVSINRGSTASIFMTIVRISAFDEPITLSLSGVPAGITHNMRTDLPSSQTNQQASFSFTASSDAVPGTYVLTVRAESQSGRIVQAPITLNILD